MRSSRPAVTCACVLSLLVVVGCHRETARSTSSAKSLKSEPAVKHEDVTKEMDPWIVGEPITHGNLTVFPVRTRTPRTDDQYLTLDEGLREGVVQVYELGGTQEAESPFEEDDANEAPNENSDDEPTQSTDGCQFANPDATAQVQVDNPSPDSGESEEQSDDNSDQQMGLGAEVERVLVSNNSNKPLYLMPGEIILGGQQDRCVAQEMVIPPNSEPVVVPVYCVEHGRWNGRSAEEQSYFAQSMHDSDDDSPAVLASVSEDKFVGSPGVLHKRGRLAVQAAKDQSAVWDEVEKANAASGNEVQSSAFTGNYADPEIAAQLEPYASALESQVSSQENVVGVIVAIDGQMQTADIFGSTPLFRKLWPKLLRSYALDAAVLSAEEKTETAQQPALTLADAQQYLEQIKAAQVTETKTQNGLVLSSRTGEDSAGERPFVTGIIPVMDGEADASVGGIGGGGLGGGGLGGAVHVGGLSQ